MQIIFACHTKPLGTSMIVSSASLLRELGRGTSGKEHQQLQKEILRLTSGIIQITTKDFTYIGHLIHSAIKDERTKKWVFQLNKELVQLFEFDSYTLIDWEQRKSLKGKELARWLQLEILSHERPFPLKLSTLQQLSGSNATEAKHFKESLKNALSELTKHRIIEKFSIDEHDLVHVARFGHVLQESTYNP